MFLSHLFPKKLLVAIRLCIIFTAADISFHTQEAESGQTFSAGFQGKNKVDDKNSSGILLTKKKDGFPEAGLQTLSQNLSESKK